MTIESIKRYEVVIEQLSEKVKTLEASNAKSNLNDQNVDNLDWLVYHKYNQNLKARLTFLDRILDWKKFSADLISGKKETSMKMNPWAHTAQLIL